MLPARPLTATKHAFLSQHVRSYSEAVSNVFVITDSMQSRATCVKLDLFWCHLSILFPVFRSFNTKNDNRLCEEQFVKGMSVFLKGTLPEKIKCELIVRQIKAQYSGIAIVGGVNCYSY